MRWAGELAACKNPTSNLCKHVEVNQLIALVPLHWLLVIYNLAKSLALISQKTLRVANVGCLQQPAGN